MKKRAVFYLLVSALLIAALALAGCGDGEKTTSSTTGAGGATTTATSTPTTTTQTTTTTTKTTSPTVTTETGTKPTTTTTTSTTQTTTPTTTTQATTTQSTTKTTTSTTSTTSPTTTTQTTTTATGESLGEILGRAAGINSVKYDMVATSTGNPTQTTHVWIKGNKMRMEMTVEGETIITLLDMDAHTMYMYYPDQNMAMKVTYEPAESAVDEAQAITDYNPVIIGHEPLDGKMCLVVEYTIEGVTARMWIWEDYGFPIKVVSTTSEGTVTVEYKNIEFTAIDDSVFELPAGVEVMDMSGMM